MVVAVSAVLYMASYEQVECSTQDLTVEDFLSVSSSNAVEFEYINCTTDDMVDYVKMASKGDQIARFFLDGGYIIIIEGNVEPIYNQEENYKGIELKLQDEYCWAYIDGMTLYGDLGRVKKAVDDYVSGETLYSPVEGKEVIDHMGKVDYMWLMNGGYCTPEMRLSWAYYDQGAYRFFCLDEEGIHTTETDDFNQFPQKIGAGKYKKKKIKIDTDMATKEVNIGIE